STGAEQWAWAGEVDGVATSPAFGPDGALYVAGRSENGAATVAFGSDGAVRWKDHRPMGGSTGSNDAPYIAVAPDGTRVATVTARLTGGIDIVALGYDAATGARAWNVTWGGPGTDIPYGVAVSPADGTIFIAGMATTQLPAARDIVVLALAPQDGAVRWVAITDGSPTTDLGLLAFSDAAAAVATDGARVFAGGSSDPVGVTVAYDAHTGAKLWSRLLAGEVMDMAALPRTGHVAVTYRAADATIEVLDGASGAPLGLAAYDEMTTADEFAWTMAADGPHLVFGGGTWITDYWFAAYDLGPLG
ncbi:MAG TPA: PQQ-binding-like beta-propeller repeat protein, partial [Candidatus Thermoplasmatota archaeon]|nr:PQQ-binding-like beta-propeller repeat protein [Candidatus Thermoplasmatota archaeon]